MANPIDWRTGKNTDPYSLLSADYRDLMIQARKGMQARIFDRIETTLYQHECTTALYNAYWNYVDLCSGNDVSSGKEVIYDTHNRD